MNSLLPYDPGILPSKPAPVAGERIEFQVMGVPPIKDQRQSIRNREHPLHGRFIALRKTSAEAMAGRAWVFAPVELELTVRCPAPEASERHSLTDYLAGVMDTLDGSSGFTFTFLPIIFEDDSQVIASHIQWEEAPQCSYSVSVAIR